MSIVTVQLGQCGNQIGGQLFQTLMSDVTSRTGSKTCSNSTNTAFCEATLERFFSNSAKNPDIWQARAVMVDMEPKVIAQTMEAARRTQTWKYPNKQQFCQKRGSGNNWAHGFCIHGPNAREKILEMVQREVEKCDHFGGFLALMSLAGGTGSGVGAFVSESLRDEYPHCFMVNQVVWPYQTGEVIVQNYNAVLTLSHLYQTSDALITMEDDSLHRICSQLQAISKVGFEDINRVITHKLAGVLQPAFRDNHAGDTYLVPNHLGAVLEHTVPQPEYKLLTVRDLPHASQTAQRYNTYLWPGLLKHLRQMLIADAAMEEGINWQVKAIKGSKDFNRSVANLILLRGQNIQQADTSPFQESHLYASWLPSNCTFQKWYHPRMLQGYEKSAALLSNSQSPLRILEPIVDKAWQMFASRAYVHQYVKHGLMEEDFLDSFAALEQVLASYKHL